MTNNVFSLALVFPAMVLYGMLNFACSAQSALTGQDYFPFDTYFNSESASIKRVHLKNFMLESKSRPDRAYIVIYSGNGQNNRKAKEELDFISRYLFRSLKVNKNRFVILVGGKRIKAVTELFFTPTGADPPVPWPSSIR